MGWLEALVLGIVQGLTEFLPISSSAHQAIIGQFFGGEDPGLGVHRDQPARHREPR